MKYALITVLSLSIINPAQASMWTALRGGARVGAAAILFTNYAIMRALVIPHVDRADIKQELEERQKLRRVYNFYKNASLVCGVGILLPKKFPPSIYRVFQKYW